MAWIILILSGVLEAVWATALGRSDGFTKPVPIIVFSIALTASMGGLAYAMRTLPTGTSYAIWVAVGAVLTVTYAMATGAETPSPAKIAFILVIIGGVIGLKLVS